MKLTLNSFAGDSMLLYSSNIWKLWIGVTFVSLTGLIWSSDCLGGQGSDELKHTNELKHTKDSLETIKTNLEEGKAVLVDVREKAEWDAGHLKGAKLIPWSKLRFASARKKLKELPNDELVVYCYCKAGIRALKAAKKLEAMGYDVRPVKAGFKELVEQGFETEK